MSQRENVSSQECIPELLVPVGGLDQLHAAVNNGADAVYLGGTRFNARGKAENFSLLQLRDAICYAHGRNVKVYVTFNTLLKDRELPIALDYAGTLWDIGADAVIVQDMGLVRMLGKNLPDLPLHMSTQGTVNGKWGVDLMKDFGIRRIVPARELSLQEIREMAEVCHGTVPAAHETASAAHGTVPAARGTAPTALPGDAGCRRTETPRRAPTCELEIFIHGALCMCYSGQCQMSRILGAAGGTGSVRSGNRGLCAQPCRLPYTDDRGRTGYFLSPKDLCLLEDIPALCEAGADSLKIEGRLKSPEYVAVVTGIYRKYLDQYARIGEIRVSAEDRQDLTQIYNRGGFTKGYLYGNPGDKILSGDSPKNTGIYIGKVRAVVDPRSAGKDRAAVAGAAKKDAVLVDTMLQGYLEEGDGVEFRASHQSERAGAAVRQSAAAKSEDVVRSVAAGKPMEHVPAAQGVAEAPAGGVVTFRRALPGGILRIGDMKGRIAAADRVFRVTQRSLLERARATYDTQDPAELDRRMRYPQKLQMTFDAAAGQPAVLTIREVKTKESREAACGPKTQEPWETVGREKTKEPWETVGNEKTKGSREPVRQVRIVSEGVMEEADHRPADPDRIVQQLQKLGGTPFSVSGEDIRVVLDGRCAVPIAQINQMRRDGIDQLLREKGGVDRLPVDMQRLAKAAQRLEGRRVKAPALPEGELVPLMEFMEAVEPGGLLPYVDAVSKGRLDAYIEKRFEEITARLKSADTGILIRGTSWIRQFLDAGVKVYGGHGLNIYNEEARLAFEEMGVRVAELSHETATAAEGGIPLMVTEHPIQSKTLTDRKGQVHSIERSPAGDKTIIW